MVMHMRFKKKRSRKENDNENFLDKKTKEDKSKNFQTVGFSVPKNGPARCQTVNL